MLDAIVRVPDGDEEFADRPVVLAAGQVSRRPKLDGPGDFGHRYGYDDWPAAFADE